MYHLKIQTRVILLIAKFSYGIRLRFGNLNARAASTVTWYFGTAPFTYYQQMSSKIYCDTGICDCGTPSNVGYVWAAGANTVNTVRSGTCASGYSGTASGTTCSTTLTWTTPSGCSGFVIFELYLKYVYFLFLVFVSAVVCPAFSTGSSVPSGCTCNAGFSGTISASTTAPNYYSGSCAGQ
jgi:hypothetical protein